jgi:hypothetical protein
VQTTSSKEDDLDITRWLEDGEQEPPDPPPSPEALSIRDTHTTGHKMSDTTTIHLVPKKAEEGPKKEEKKTPKPPSRFERPKKPLAVDSRDAANDTLKHFFNRKKS